MKLYVAYCNDRHVDPVIRVFSDRDKACEFARTFMADNMAHPEHVKVERVQGYILFLRYDLESDHAYVQQVTLDEAD